jgi:hypothetical protein
VRCSSRASFSRLWRSIDDELRMLGGSPDGDGRAMFNRVRDKTSDPTSAMEIAHVELARKKSQDISLIKRNNRSTPCSVSVHCSSPETEQSLLRCPELESPEVRNHSPHCLGRDGTDCLGSLDKEGTYVFLRDCRFLKVEGEKKKPPFGPLQWQKSGAFKGPARRYILAQTPWNVFTSQL